MLDKYIQAKLKPLLGTAAQGLERAGMSANGVTTLGLVIGLAAAFSIACQQFVLGALLIMLSRIFDGLDGALARLGKPSDRGGFLDISFDFLFYAAIPLAFAFANPSTNALAAAVLLASFVGTGSSFLAFATIAEKRAMQNTALPNKSFYFLGGITEASETIAAFLAMCLWPQYFAPIAWFFAVLCLVTTGFRIFWGYQTFADDK